MINVVPLFFIATIALCIPVFCNSKKLGQGKIADGGELTNDDKQALVDKHNEYRSNVALGNMNMQPMATNMLKLIWDESIAITAKAHADKCKFEHDFNSGFGENLYTEGSTADQIDNIEVLEVGVEKWVEEGNDFTFNNGECSASSCGHYVQAVWAIAQKVGCGYAECPLSTFGAPYEILFVCRYDEGVITRRSPYESTDNSNLVASDCPLGYDGDSASGLCVLNGESTTTAPPVEFPVNTPVATPTASPVTSGDIPSESNTISPTVSGSKIIMFSPCGWFPVSVGIILKKMKALIG